MKLNNKGFAISSIMYIILVLAVILVSLILVTLSSRKLILDKLKSEVLTTIYEAPNLTYRQTIKKLKNETIAYMTDNSLEKESIKVDDSNFSIDSDTLEKYKLNDKYVTAIKKTDSYNVYLGKTKTIENVTTLPKNTIDIVDYKIYGNSIQEGENLFDINNSNVITGYISDNGFTIKNGTKSVVIECEPNTKYKVSKIASARFAIGFSEVLPEAGTIISNISENFSKTSLTATSPDGSNYLIIWLYNSTYDEMTLNAILKTLKVTYADIEPTPDIPIEVESVGSATLTSGAYDYIIPITASKNLFNSILIEQGTIADASGKLSSSDTRVRTKLTPLDAGTYVLNILNYEINKIFIRGIHIYNYDTESWEKYTGYNSKNATFTLEKPAKVRIVFNTGNSDQIEPEDLLEENPVLQLGETIEEDITTKISLDEPLRKIDSYVDYVDSKNNKLIRNVKELVFNGEEDWRIYDPNTDVERLLLSSPDMLKGSSGFSNICLINSSAWGMKTFVGQFDSNGLIRFYRPFYTGAIVSSEISHNAWKSFLKERYNVNNPVKVNYVLETPTEQTASLPHIDIMEDAYTLSIDTDLEPSSYEFTILEKIIEI